MHVSVVCTAAPYTSSRPTAPPVLVMSLRDIRFSLSDLWLCRPCSSRGEGERKMKEENEQEGRGEGGGLLLHVVSNMLYMLHAFE